MFGPNAESSFKTNSANVYFKLEQKTLSAHPIQFLYKTL